MSLRHEHNGGGGGGSGQKTTIVSPDESIKVVENENDTEVSVDWSKAPIDTEDPFAHVVKDADGIHLSFDLVTETRNGIARAFDKKLLDHSFANTANMVEVTSAQEASYFLNENDEQYEAENGQIIGWQDQNGKKHLSRYTKIGGWDLPRTACWGKGVFDEKHGTLVVIQRRSSTSDDRGPFNVAVRNLYGNWRYVEGNISGDQEIWEWLEYGNGYVVALSGNRSMEVAVSEDGGYTFEKRILPGDLYWRKIRYNERLSSFFIIARNAVYYTYDFLDYYLLTDDDTYSYYDCVFDYDTAMFCILARNDSNVYLLRGTNHTLEQSPAYTITQNVSVTQMSEHAGKCILFNGDSVQNQPELLFEDIWTTPSLYAQINTSGGTKVSDIFIYEENGTVYYDTMSYNTSYYSSAVTKYSWAVSFVKTVNLNNYGVMSRVFRFKDRLFIYGGDWNNHPSSSSFAVAFELTTLNKINDEAYWEELPQIPEDTRGLIGIEDKEVYEVGVQSPYLELKERTLKANASDRYTDYANYRLERVTPTETYVVWCNVELSNMVDGSTKVYEDESCTTEVGIVKQHNYNPNNPNDVEITIDGTDYVYAYIDSKTPVSLATTKAVVDGLTNMATWIANNIYSGVGNAIWKSTDLGTTWAAVGGVTYTAGQGFLVTIYNTVNDMVVVTNDGQQPAVDRSNWVIYYQCVQMSGSFTTYLGCRYTDGNHTDALVLVV